MSEYRNSVPDNWFVDPVRLGIPGIRRPADDEGALAWQADALCAQTDPEAFFPKRVDPPGMQRKFARGVKSNRSAWNMR